MLTKAFWKATGERSVRTFAQVLVGSLGLDQLGIIHANWTEGLELGAGAAVLAVLTAVATSGGTEGPGLTETVRARQDDELRAALQRSENGGGGSGS